MASPKVKIIAISNVYARCMYFENKGDIEFGHCHTYDHGTLVSSGSVLVEMLDDDDAVIGSRSFVAPGFIFISKLKRHKITALENKTVAVCIHALRDVEENILAPDFLINEKWFADTWQDSNFVDDHIGSYMDKNHGVKIDSFAISPQERDFRFNKG
jgi:hypothetical protein